MNNNHINNLKVLSGSNGLSRYEYILSQDQLYKSYFDCRKDLNYALRKETKRDRYIENMEGLEASMQKEIIDAIVKSSDIITEMIADNMVRSINSAVEGGTIKSKSFEIDMGKALGKAFGKMPFVILDEIINNDEQD